MNGIQVRFDPGGLGVLGRAIYQRKDLWLHYESQGEIEDQPKNLAESINRQLGISPDPFLLIADTLTMVFGTEKRKLISLDSYTSDRFWLPSEKNSVPSVTRGGSLVVENVGWDADRGSIRVEPRYIVSEDKDWVRIILKDASEKDYFEVGRDLVVGLVDGAIADIYLLNLEWRE